MEGRFIENKGVSDSEGLFAKHNKPSAKAQIKQKWLGYAIHTLTNPALGETQQNLLR
jgi:hypothetical protein